MADRSRTLARTSSHVSDNGSSSSIRPRNRRLNNTDEPSPSRSPGLLSAFNTFSAPTSRGTSPLPRSNSPATGNLGQFFSDSWTQSWSSVQDLTSNILNAKIPTSAPRIHSGGSSWGPDPSKPGIDDVAAGSLSARHAALKAARTASVLESHEGVNGGLNVKHKRRNSDEVVTEGRRDDDYLVYVHHVKRDDSYAGLILRYRCREDAFRKANGLWSRDSLQTRRWLTIPVAACDVRGRPCEAPSWHNSQAADLLAPTSGHGEQDGFFGKKPAAENTQEEKEEDKPWTHVRWVKIDSIPEPVEIGRVARGTMGYFPPRRKKSIRTETSASSPRESFDLPSVTSPTSTTRPPSSLSGRPRLLGQPGSSHSRLGSDAAGDVKPAWMRQPGGVGTMGRSSRAPGPAKDYFNTWTKKHIPGLNIDAPSMSIMGSETAQFGFGKDSSAIVESPFEDGRDASTSGQASGQGNGLDRAAAAVETWLRGALAKTASTPRAVSGSRPLGGAGLGGDGAGDLIELADTNSDDGRMGGDLLDIGNMSFGTSSWSNGASGAVRGRTAPKGGKDE